MSVACFFFFSSRRRHTSSKRDWSSDVCSSDLAPLSIAAKERLAGKLIPVSVAAGEQVVRAGDTGDRFYIVGDGELDVEIGDDHKTARGTDYFGEIALLRDVPRTATVTATVDSP